tara:strand:+ start:15511 stop:16188 length:678 start_codon:yes stop_codon:yes gene_type:complete
MMPLSKDKKILIYLFLIILLGSVNNRHFTDTKFFEIKNFKLVGLSEIEKLDLVLQFEQIKDKNIFSLSKKEITSILNSNNLIESFIINKNYPSGIDVIIQKTIFLANININNENFLIGSNRKLIKSDIIYTNLPIILGNPSLDDFFLIINNISKSSIEFDKIKKLYFFPSKRWDIELNSGIMIKLPINSSIDVLNDYSKIKNLQEFNDVKIFDLRVNKQIIVNEL